MQVVKFGRGGQKLARKILPGDKQTVERCVEAQWRAKGFIIGGKRAGYFVSEGGSQRPQGTTEHPAAEAQKGDHDVIVALAGNRIFAAKQFHTCPLATLSRIQRERYGIADK